MLAAPVSTTLITKKHVSNITYSLNQVINILTLADQLMDPGTCRLFKEGYDNDAVELFKLNILPKIDVPMTAEQLKDLVLGTFARSPVKYKSESMNHVWAQLIKSSVKDCFLLGYDIQSISCWHLFTSELKKVHAAYLPTLEKQLKEGQPRKFGYYSLGPDDVHRLFLNFMALLEWSGNVKATTLLHQFLYILKKVSKSSSSTMSTIELGTFAGSALLYSLRRNCYAPEEKEKMGSDECYFFAKITALMLEHPIFDKPYEQADYRIFLCSQDRVFQIRDELVERLRPQLWPVEVLTLETVSVTDEWTTGFAKMKLDDTSKKKKSAEKDKVKSKSKDADKTTKKEKKDKKDKIDKKDKKESTQEENLGKEKEQSEVIKELKTVLDTKGKKVSIHDEPIALLAPAYAKSRLSVGPLTPRKLTDQSKDTVTQIRPS